MPLSWGQNPDTLTSIFRSPPFPTSAKLPSFCSHTYKPHSALLLEASAHTIPSVFNNPTPNFPFSSSSFGSELRGPFFQLGWALAMCFYKLLNFKFPRHLFPHVTVVSRLRICVTFREGRNRVWWITWP